MRIIRDPVDCFARWRHPGNAKGVIRDRYERWRLLRSRVCAAAFHAAARLATMLNVSAPSTSAAFKQLVEAKILTEKTGFKRSRRFVAQEVLGIYKRSP